MLEGQVMKRLPILALAALAGCFTAPIDAGEVRVTYACENGTAMVVIYEGEIARIVNRGGEPIWLRQRPAGSGVWYESATHSLRGEDEEILYTVGRMAPVRCRQTASAD